MLTELRCFSVGGGICHCKSSIFKKTRLECPQTRRKTIANSRKTGTNSRKRAHIKKRYHLHFQICPLFNSDHYEGFWLTYFDVTNVWWPLCCLDYLKAARIWLYLRDYFSQGKACCWSICVVTGDVLTFQEILSMFLNIEHFECNKRTWQLAFFVSISTGHKFRYHLWVKVFIYTP